MESKLVLFNSNFFTFTLKHNELVANIQPTIVGTLYSDVLAVTVEFQSLIISAFYSMKFEWLIHLVNIVRVSHQIVEELILLNLV